jgi:ribonucleoside-diphosphate reductase alpha chain
MKLTRYEDVQNQTTEEYFNGNQFSIDAFNKKYTDRPGETYVRALKRVCDYVASVEETEELRRYWSERWFDEIYNDWWHPAGSIMQGAGSGKKVSLVNCTTVSLGTVAREGEEWDSLESIIRGAAYTVAKSAAYRQGLGVDFSRLRPRGAAVQNSARESTGAVHWMKFIDQIGYFVGQKGRIPAMLFSLSCSHPDVFEFVRAKADRTNIQNANISVQCTNAFYRAVEADGDWELVFDSPAVEEGDKVYVHPYSATPDCKTEVAGGLTRHYYVAAKGKPAERFSRTVRARELLELIAKYMTEHAEPGIQNIDTARQYSNSDWVYDPLDEYDSRIISTNACSEQYLSADSNCSLASQNAGRFSTDPALFEAEQEKVGESMNRFLDNVNECEVRYRTYATDNQRLALQKLRRTGAGVTNWCAWLFKRGLEYGTPEGNRAVEKYMERFNYHLYRSSIALGREKGSFGLFDRAKLERSPFIQRMMGLGLEFDALRNVTVSSIAPTGTLSLMFRGEVLSYGAEPGFGLYFWKRTRISGKYDYYFCVPAVVREYFRAQGVEIPMTSDTVRDTWDGEVGRPIAEFIEAHRERVGAKFRRATEVSPFDKLDLMAGLMKWVDSSISITYALPEGTDWKTVYDFILLGWKSGVKSLAAFPDRQMYGIVSYEPFKDLAGRLLAAGQAIHPQNFTEEELAQMNVPAPKRAVPKTDAPKRPQELPCEVWGVTVKGQKFTVLVGLLGGEPYEVFSLNQAAPRGLHNGFLEKIKRGAYRLLGADRGVVIEDVTDLTTEEEDALTRMVSTALRHGADLAFVVHQLEKTKGELTSFAKSIARVLKKYVQDGTKVSGEVCGKCEAENTLVRQEGCVSCTNCGWSKCS